MKPAQQHPLRSSRPGSLTHAFTMIEVLIAISILTVIIYAIYASWTAILRGARVGQNAAAEVQRARIALRSIEQAITGVQMFSMNAVYYSFNVDTTGDSATLSLATRLPASFPGNGVTRALYGDQAVRRVTFAVEPGVNSGNQLVMTQSPLLLDTNSTLQQYSLVLASNLSRFSIEFWATNGGVADWSDEWTQTNQLPSLLRISLEFASANSTIREPVEVLTKEIALAAMAIPQAYEIPTVQGAAGGGRGGRGGPPGGGRPGGPRGPGDPTRPPVPPPKP
jgi:prepilin-type N-terminal cleavage/methylation domain-containing protein